MTQLGSVSPCKKTYENYQVIDTYPWLSMTEQCFATSNAALSPKTIRYDQRKFLSVLGLSVMQAINGIVDAETALATAQENYQRILTQAKG